MQNHHLAVLIAFPCQAHLAEVVYVCLLHKLAQNICVLGTVCVMVSDSSVCSLCCGHQPES